MLLQSKRRVGVSARARARARARAHNVHSVEIATWVASICSLAVDRSPRRPACLAAWNEARSEHRLCRVVVALNPPHTIAMTGMLSGTHDMISMLLDLQTDIKACMQPPLPQAQHTLPTSDLIIHPPRALTTRTNKQTHLQPRLPQNTQHIPLHNLHPPHHQPDPKILRRPLNKHRLPM